MLSASEILVIDSNIADANVDLLMSHYYITGNLYTPNGVWAAGNYTITMDSSLGEAQNVQLNQNSISVEFSLKVPVGINIISYSVVYGDESYINVGYYNKIGTMSEAESATPIEVVDEDVEGIDLYILVDNYTLSGTIGFEEGVTIADDLTVKVIGPGLVEQEVSVPSGTDTDVPFELTIPRGNSGVLEYTVTNGVCN